MMNPQVCIDEIHVSSIPIKLYLPLISLGCAVPSLHRMTRGSLRAADFDGGFHPQLHPIRVIDVMII